MSNDLLAQESAARMSKMTGKERREMNSRIRTLKGFSFGFVGVQLRPYQVEAANAVIRSVFERDGENLRDSVCASIWQG